MRIGYLVTAVFLLRISAFASGEMTSQSNDNLLKKMMIEKSILDSNLASGRNHWMSLSAGTDHTMRLYAVKGEYGVHLGSFVGLTLKAELGQSSFSVFRTNPNSTDSYATPAAYDVQSEIYRTRNDSDTWSYLTLQPGVEVAGKLLPDRMANFTEIVRFSIGSGYFKDSVNSLTFLADYLISYEAGVVWQYDLQSPWALTFNASLTQGILRAQNLPGMTAEYQNRLPVNYSNFLVGFRHAH